MSGIGVGQALSRVVMNGQVLSCIVKCSQVWLFMWAKLIHFPLYLTFMITNDNT